MRRVWLVGALLGVLVFVGPSIWGQADVQAQSEPDHEFTIAVGETLTFDARGVRRVAPGDESVADTRTSADSRYLFITGRSPGITTVNIHRGAGEDDKRTVMIRVVEVNPSILADEVREVLGEGAGVDIRVVNGRVLIEGEVSGEIFQEKIDQLTEMYPGQVLNFATYREAFVEGARMVALDVYFIQIATTNSDNLGVRWNQFIGANMTGGSGDVPLYYQQEDLGPGVLPGDDGALPPRPMALTGGDGLNTYSSLVGNLNFALDFLVEQGVIQTIQQATVVTEAGSQVDYLAGGSIIIPLITQQTVRYEERPFGLDLSVTPVLDFENRVKLDIEMDYSEVDFSLGVGDLPGFRSTAVNSTVNLQEGQSILVTAHEEAVSSTTESGFAVLSNIPILGWAFKSRSLQAEEQNNALFITPRVYEPGSDGHRTLVQGVFQSLLDGGASPDQLPELEDSQ